MNSPFLLAALLSVAGPAPAVAYPPAPGSTSTQLVVLFDPTSEASPTPKSLIASVNAGSALGARLGGPIHAEQMLRDAQPLSAAEAARNPKAPRALLERYVILTYSTPAKAAVAKAKLYADPQVLSVETNTTYEVSATPTDQFFAPNGPGTTPAHYQWGMQAMNFPAAWDKERGFAYIAAVDSGIAYAPGYTAVHPDLQQNFRPQLSANFRAGSISDNLKDSIGHGTHVAGIMAATPQFGPFKHGPNPPSLDLSTGVAGACWTCSLSVLAAYPMLPEAADAIRFAADHGIQVINMSWGDAKPALPNLAPADCNATPYSAICQAITYAASRGVVMVAAAGNHNQNRVQFPASHPDVIAVGGIEYTNAVFPGSPPYAFKGKFWNLGYGQFGATCSAGIPGNECGSNYGPEVQVVAPAKDVYSTIGLDHMDGEDFHNLNLQLRCGDSFPYQSTGEPGMLDYYGTCTGTSMAAPHVSGLAGLVRSANPLAEPYQVRMWISGYTAGCENWDLKCGAGIPNAALSVQAALGHANAVNRRTPLFAFYSTTAQDHFYTTIPQMASAALQTGLLLPQPFHPARRSAYGPIGTTVPSYPAFPLGCAFSPCATPRAIASIMTTHVSPVDGSALTPLYRYSFSCLRGDDTVPPSGPCHANPRHISHVYAANRDYDESYYPSEEHDDWIDAGYELDGIEGYIFPKEKPQPAGTVRLCRKYDAARDDYVLFTSPASDKIACSASSDGHTGGNYQLFDSGWIGYVYPAADPQPLCPVGVPCS